MQKNRSMRLRFSNRLKCLLCYLIAFSLPLLWHVAALAFLYPYQLAMTAPDVAPLLDPLLPALPEADTYRQAVEQREALWLAFVAAMGLSAWLCTLAIQLLWRFTRRCSVRPFRAAQRAVRSLRAVLLCILLLNAGAAWLLWHVGVSRIAGHTLWDFIVYFGIFVLLPVAAWFVSRYAAPPALSGRHGYFKRI